jgi:hypothetical protein
LLEKGHFSEAGSQPARHSSGGGASSVFSKQANRKKREEEYPQIYRFPEYLERAEIPVGQAGKFSMQKCNV